MCASVYGWFLWWCFFFFLLVFSIYCSFVLLLIGENSNNCYLEEWVPIWWPAWETFPGCSMSCWEPRPAAQAHPSEPSPLSLAPTSCPGEPPGTHQAVFPNVPPCLCLAFNISWNLLVEYVSASSGSHSSHQVLPFWWVSWLLHRLSCSYSTLMLSLSRDGCRPHRILTSLWEIGCVVAVLLPVYEQAKMSMLALWETPLRTKWESQTLQRVLPSVLFRREAILTENILN